MPLLAESLVLTPHRYSLVFVAFTGHKDLAGSAAYLKSLSDDERKAIRAMIDLDQIGRTPATFSFATVQAASGLTPLGPTKQITHDDTPMSKLLPLAAITLKDTDYAHQNREQLFTDAQNFERAGTLALTITSPAYTKLVRPGNTEVSMARTELDPKVYYQTYNLLCVYTLYLDRGIAPPKAKPSTDVAKAVPVPATSNTPPAAAPPASPAAIPASAAAVVKPLLPSSEQPVASTPPPVAQAPAETLPAPTFRSTTRLVQVDVVVTDKAGNPITGLKQDDFTVFQDGKPQPVRAFEAHVLTPEARKTRVIPTLPPNTYTNLPDSIQDQSWTIVLYDQLNTPTSDQQVARISLESKF